MTVIISLPHPQMIVMSADSRKSERLTPIDFHTLQPIGEPTIKYVSMTKVFPVPSIGCVTLWGEVTKAENDFPRYLDTNQGSIQTVEGLCSLVERYLREDLQADQIGEDVGFHVGGFMPDGKPRLYHVFWGWDRPRPEGQMPDYRLYDSSDQLALYNGRNDFVDPIMQLLRELQRQVGISLFDNDPIQRIVLVDFLTRYISRFAPDVGGDIHTVLIKPNNENFYIRNSGNGILPRYELERLLNDLISGDNENSGNKQE